MTPKVTSGQERLDQILNGGIPKGSISLIIGIPGSGKTILAQQFAFHNAKAGRTALYLSLITEPFDKIVGYGQTLEFFDIGAVKDGRVIFEDIGRALTSGGLDGVLAALGQLLKVHRPDLVIIDSFRAMRAFAASDAAYRLFLDALTRQLSASTATSIWIDEYERFNAQDAPEFAVADTIIALDTKQVAEREHRTLQVLKMRGSGFLSGQHAYRVSARGVDVFPRLADVQDPTSYSLDRQRLHSGVEALDRMLGDGLWPGASSLLIGPTGAGKTLIGLHFLFAGARNGEPGILASFQENRTQLERIAGGFGWSFDSPGIHVLSRSPIDVYVDEWVYELLDLIDAVGAKRVVIDSLRDVMAAAGDAIRFREWMFSLVQRLSRAGVTILMTHESPDLFELGRLSEDGLSHLADNVIALQYVRAADRITRTLTVFKSRATRHDSFVRAYKITPEGIAISDTATIA